MREQQLLSISDDGEYLQSNDQTSTMSQAEIHQGYITCRALLSLPYPRSVISCGHIQKVPQHSSTGRQGFQSCFVSISTYFLTQAHIQRLLFETPYEFLFKRETATLFLTVVHAYRTLLDLKKAWFSFLESNAGQYDPTWWAQETDLASEHSCTSVCANSSLWSSAPLA